MQIIRSFNNPVFLITGIFAFAMGLLETIVVVYLRELYYPGGFNFPLAEFSPWLLKVELLRETVTVIMLISVGILAGKTMIRSFAFFLYAFAVWDIAYYIGLKLLIDWPASLFTWDILFLIPVAWVGPVISPVLCSIAMIVLAGTIIKMDNLHHKPVVSSLEWMLLILGSMVVFSAFIQDYSMLILKADSTAEFRQAVTKYIPHKFNWYLFFTGFLVICSGIISVMRRSRLK